ncbi:hypothetical protein BST61_g2775 [Cercospora zeina]
MNTSGSLSIRYGEISGGGSGSYLTTEALQNSNMNFPIDVNVVNRTLNIKDQLMCWPVRKKKANNYTKQQFTDTYGDCFISGFQEGGTFTAMISIRIGVGPVDAKGDFQKANEELNKKSKITIGIDTLQDIAVKFPDLVAECPQRTHATLTRYSALRGYM